MQDITIIPAAFDGATVPAVNARDLHAFLGVKRDFNAWMKTQIKRARLVEGRDYLTYHEVVQVPHQGGMRSQTVTEYTVTVDAAKHIGMMSGTDKGFEVRDYFIACERAALAAVPQSITMEIHQRMMAYERKDKVTFAPASRAAYDMLARKEALKDLREEKSLLEDITQLRLLLGG